MSCYILNMKMTLQSLSNFTELLAVACGPIQKFENDFDVYFMFIMQ